MTGTVFISYSEKDLRVVSQIIGGLEKAGYHTWSFSRDVLPGTSYLLQIHDAVDNCQAVVLVASSNSVASEQVSREVVGAFERHKPLFPVLLDLTPPQLKELQPEWRLALGGATMICVNPANVHACISRMIEGLQAIGIQPGGRTKSTAVPEKSPFTPASYVPKHLADKILAARKSMEGERKEVTILFADVTGFTSMSEEMDPEEVHNLVREVLAFLVEEVHHYEGTVAQFLGDGIMALFGAPVAHEDSPQRALHAALGIRERVREHAARLEPQGIEFNMRIGVNTGVVVVGRIGTDLTMEYTAMGDTVNLASRMESTAAPGTIRVAESTYRLAEGFFEFRPLGEITVKRKEQPVKAYELLGPGRATTRLGASKVRGLTPFVGRNKELNHLLECYQRVKNGQGQVVGIVGEPGVGKSRLLLRMRETLPKDDHTYLEGGCFHYGDAMPYLPLLGALRTYFNIDGREPESAAIHKMKATIEELDERLKTYLPPLQDILSFKVDDERYLRLEPPRKKEQAFEALRNLFIRQSQRRPLILTMEDLHWMDRTSDEFLGQLVNSLAHSRIFLVLLYRPEYTNPWTSKSYYSQIQLDELSPQTSCEMVEAIFGEGKPADELKELILSRSAGNPLFIEELTRTLMDQGYIQRRNGQHVLTAKPSDVQMPGTVQGIIGARMDRLDEELRHTLQVSSVIGRTFSLSVLQNVVGSQGNIKSNLAALQAAEFIYEETLFPEPEYIFKHALTQEVAYKTLLLKKRREIHESIGETIEKLYPDRMEEFYEVLSHHYARSQNQEKAFHYLRLASVKAGVRNCVVESVRFGREAIDLLAKMPQTEANKRSSIQMRLLLSGPLAALGDGGYALQMMEEGARLAEEIGDDHSLADLHGAIGMHASTQGDAARGVEYAEKAYRAAERTGDLVLMATVCFDFCLASNATGGHMGIVDVAPRVLSLLEKGQMEKRSDLGRYYNLNLYSIIMSYYGTALGCLGDFQKGRALSDRACHFAGEAGSVYAQALAELLYARMLIAKGDGSGAMEHMEKGAKYGEQGQMAVMQWWEATIRGQAHYLMGDLETARHHFERGLEIHRNTQYASQLSLNHYGLGLVFLDSGDVEKAQVHVEESLRLANRHGEREQEGRSTVALGRVLGRADSSASAKAEGLILAGLGALEELKVKPRQGECYLYLGDLYTDTDQKEKALRALRRAENMFREMGMDYWLARTKKALEKLQG